MSFARKFVLSNIIALLLANAACEKKRSPLTVTGPKTAPTLSQSLPKEIEVTKVPAPPEQPTEVATESEPVKKKPKKPRATSRKAAPPPANTQPPATDTAAAAPQSNPTVATASAPHSPVDAAAEVAIGPDVSSQRAAQNRDNTSHQLDTMDQNLKAVNAGNLNGDQKAMLTQIRAYIEQSRKAITDGDYERASNLAKKAQLLMDELIKQ